jgi:hypothetical protein
MRTAFLQHVAYGSAHTTVFIPPVINPNRKTRRALARQGARKTKAGGQAGSIRNKSVNKKEIV